MSVKDWNPNIHLDSCTIKDVRFPWYDNLGSYSRVVVHDCLVREDPNDPTALLVTPKTEEDE